MTAVPVFALNIFFIIVPLVSSLNFFGNSSVINAGGMINPLYATYNAFVSIIFIYVGVGMINKASGLLAGFLGTEDMISQGKDLTGKALSTVGTASKGAAIVGGMTLAGPAAVLKGGMGKVAGMRASSASKRESRKAALADLDKQIATATAEGDTRRVAELQDRRDNYSKYSRPWKHKEIEDGLERAKSGEEFYSNKIAEANAANKDDMDYIAQKQAELKKAEKEDYIKAMRMKNKGIAWKGSKEQIEADARRKAIKDEIAERQKIIADRNKDKETDIKYLQKNVDNERFYSSFDRTKEMAKNAREDGIKVGDKKYLGSKARREKSLTGDLKELQGKYNDSALGKFMKDTPIINSTVGSAFNWAVNKALFGGTGIVAQVADRKFGDVPKNGLDFVKGIDSSAGAVVEKFMDPGTIGKVISTADENKKRETQKEEKARKEVWEENAKREKDKVKAEEKALADMQKKEAIMQQLRDWETYKMGGFNLSGDSINVNTDRNETFAKNYKSLIDKKAEEDYKKDLYKTDKDFERFKKMLKELDDEDRKKPQKVTIDSGDKNVGEQIAKAMKTVNAQSNKQLKDINSGIASLSKTLEDLIKKMK